MGLGDFVKGVGEAVGNVAKGAAWVANPTHWDDVAEGVGKGVEFVAEHPGKAWDTAFEVGRAVVKDQLDPVNLAINAGLLAATVATGGAAAPAFIAKMGLTAKSAQAGVSALKVADTVGDVAKGVSTATKAVRAGETALKAADTVGDVARTTRTAAKALDTVGDVAKTADTVTDAARGGSKALELADKALGLNPGKFGTKASNILNPLENSRFGMAAARERGAARLLEAGGEAPGLARQVGAAVLQGGGKGAGMAKQLPGMSDKVYGFQKNVARAQAVGKRLHTADQFSRGVEVAADPMSAVEDQATDYVNSTTHAAGYSDRGATKESMYGNSSQVAGPGDHEQLAIGRGSQVSDSPYRQATPDEVAGGLQPHEAFWQRPVGPNDPVTGTVYTNRPQTQTGGGGAGVPPVGGSPTMASATPPPSSGGGPSSRKSAFTQGTQPPQTSSTASTATPADHQVTENLYGMDEATSQAAASSGRGMHYWEGPRSQWAGGIKSSYDWRPMEPLRPIRTGHGPAARTSYKTEGDGDTADDTADTAAPGTNGDLNAQGAPKNFSPEVPKSGMYALSAGQAPVGTGFPTTRFGESSGRSRLNNVRTLTQPIGAIGPGADRTGNAVIDADSSSPDDLGFDNSGQGYFNFANTMGTAAVGPQPNTSPMYSQGSRTSRRSTGMLGV
jgi:hypothetical protein